MQRHALLDNLAKWSRVKPVQVRQWVLDLNNIVGDMLQHGEKSPWIGRFWVRLYATLAEVVPYYEEMGDLLDAVGVDHPPVKKACAALNAIRQELTDEEIILLEYERNCESHVFQTSYCLQLRKKDGTIKDCRGVSLLKKQLTIFEIDEILERLIAQHGINEKALAVALAKRVDRAVHELVGAVLEATR